MVGFKKVEYENPPVGSYPFRCYGVIDFGSQKHEDQYKKGEFYTVPEVNFLFEFPTKLMKDGRPFTSRAHGFNFNVKLTSKSRLMKFLKAWLPNENIDANYKFNKLIGKTGIAGVVHDESKDGTKTYANIASVMPLMDGMEVPKAFNEAIYVSLDEDWDEKEFAKLTTYYQDIIKESPEYNAIMDKQASGMQKAVAENFPKADVKPVDDSQDIPF